MFSVPLATVGGFLGLRLVRHLDPTQQLDTLTMLGFIILIGVVVNNAILLVHQALNFMRGIGESEHDCCEPLSPREAIRESVKTRIRPIFMTTLTSVFGMLPLVLAPGAGSELYRGLGAVVVGGLVLLDAVHAGRRAAAVQPGDRRASLPAARSGLDRREAAGGTLCQPRKTSSSPGSLNAGRHGRDGPRVRSEATALNDSRIPKSATTTPGRRLRRRTIASSRQLVPKLL